MMRNFIFVRIKNKNKLKLNNNKFLEFFKLSVGNNINILNIFMN